MLNPRQLIKIVTSALSIYTRPTLVIRVRSPRYFTNNRPVRTPRVATNGRGLTEVARVESGFASVANDDRVATQAEPDDSVWQQLTRRTSPDGADELTGSMQVAFEAQQRTTICHLVFCPAFAQVPAIEIEPSAGPDCRVTATHVYAYGARIELKLVDVPAESTSVRFDFIASCTTV